jgi:hypothetical protein
MPFIVSRSSFFLQEDVDSSILTSELSAIFLNVSAVTDQDYAWSIGVLFGVEARGDNALLDRQKVANRISASNTAVNFVSRVALAAS